MGCTVLTVGKVNFAELLLDLMPSAYIGVLMDPSLGSFLFCWLKSKAEGVMLSFHGVLLEKCLSSLLRRSVLLLNDSSVFCLMDVGNSIYDHVSFLVLVAAELRTSRWFTIARLRTASLQAHSYPFPCSLSSSALFKICALLLYFSFPCKIPFILFGIK